MARVHFLKGEHDAFAPSIFEAHRGVTPRPHWKMIENKIEDLERMSAMVSNRRSRRWLNDRLLIELVPRMNAGEIRSLFAPPPWGDDTPLSAFCMTNVGEWDLFRSIDMDTEGRMIKALAGSAIRKKVQVDMDKVLILNAWHRVDCRTREALRRTFRSDLVASYEERLLSFIKDGDSGDVLVLHVQDPFQRLLLHGVCEFYNLNSTTVSTLKDSKLWKTTKIKKNLGSQEAHPNITLCQFLRMAKEGVW